MIVYRRKCAESRALIVLLAVLLDLGGGDPPNVWHPVAWFGRLAGRLERAAPADGRLARLTYGALLTFGLVIGSALVGRLLERAACRLPRLARLLLFSAALKSSLSLRGLVLATENVARALERGQLDLARRGLRSLVSRPAAQLSPAQVASAAVESAAENLADSIVAPLAAYVLGGLPGTFAYRAANTLDAMIGYHGAYEHLGKTAARLDDLMNLLPSRLSALLLVAAAGLGLGDPREAIRTLAADRARTESPNAGWPMSAAAGALRVRLEKPGHYCLGEHLADPGPEDVRRAAHLVSAAAAVAIGLAAAALARSDRRAQLP